MSSDQILEALSMSPDPKAASIWCSYKTGLRRSGTWPGLCSEWIGVHPGTGSHPAPSPADSHICARTPSAGATAFSGLLPACELPSYRPCDECFTPKRQLQPVPSFFIFPPIRRKFLKKSLWLDLAKNSVKIFETHHYFFNHYYFFIVTTCIN